MKLILSSVLAATLAVPFVGHAQSTSEPFSVLAISEVKEANTRVTALAIDFRKPLPLNWTLASAFHVSAELGPVTSYEGKRLGASGAPKAPRTILRAYTSDRPEMGAPRAGQFVIIEMDADDFNASSWYTGYNPGFRQILPYGDEMYYDLDLLHDLTYLPSDTSPTAPPAEVEVISAEAWFEIQEHKIRTADAFQQGVFRQSQNTEIAEISYNFYDPQVPEKTPLVIFLHGSGQSHDTINHADDITADTRAPLLTNQGAVTWVENAREPVFVLAPQAPARDMRDAMGEGGWRSRDAYSLLVGLIDDFIARHPTIDTDRIYLTGLSMGAMGSWKLLTDPDDAISGRFAAALLMNGISTNIAALPVDDPDTRRAAAANAMREISYDPVSLPIWITHSDTDPVVHVDGSRIPFSLLTSATVDDGGVVPSNEIAISESPLAISYRGKNVRSGEEVLYTEYLYGDGGSMLDLGMVTPNAHFSWEVSFKDQDIIDWMLAQSLD